MARRSFHHLTFTQRLQLEAYLKAKLPARQIAALLDVHISTVYREVKRGVYEHLDGDTWLFQRRYSPDIAEQNYRDHLHDKGGDFKIGHDYKLANYIEQRIVDDGLTPLAVIGEIRKKALHFDTTICVRTLYHYIEKGLFLRLSPDHLPFKGIRKKKPCVKQIAKPPRGESIERRPQEVAERKIFGHWEMDCVCSANRDTHSLLTLVERVTRKTIIVPLPAQKMKYVIEAMDGLERKFGKSFSTVFKTITVDNGREFSDCKALEQSVLIPGEQRTKLYYCHPYCSCERGTNERMNREVRRKFPKSTNFKNVSATEVQKVEDWLNNYPRGVLDYATPNEVYNSLMATI